jgi:hypothetical protein
MSDVMAADKHSFSYLSNMKNSALVCISQALSQINHSQLQESDGYEKHPLICMREVLSTGQSSLIESTLKQLLYLVNNSTDANSIDALSFATVHQPKSNASERHDKGQTAQNSAVHYTSCVPSLLGRDLRRLDYDSYPNEEPSIRIRKHSILISIDPIRAIIMSTRMIIIVPPGGMDQILEIVEKYTRGESHLHLCSTNRSHAHCHL